MILSEEASEHNFEPEVLGLENFDPKLLLDPTLAIFLAATVNIKIKIY